MDNPLKWLEIFRAGEHTSSNGITRDYSVDELQQVAETYNPDHFKAPLIVSYPAHNTGNYSDAELHKSQLAFGFPEAVRVVGDRLMAGFRAISPKVKEWIDNGQILGFSSSFYLPESPRNPYPGKLALRHVAGCGVDVPAVKGLTAPQFSEAERIDSSIYYAEPLEFFPNYSEDDEGAVEFALELDDETIVQVELGKKLYDAVRAVEAASFGEDGGEDSLASLFREFYRMQRDRYIDANGLEEADQVFPTDFLDRIDRAAAKAGQCSGCGGGMDGEEEGDYEPPAMQLEMPDMPIVYQEEDMSDERYEQLEADNSELRARIADLEASHKRLEGEREVERVTAFAEGLVRDRLLLDRDKEKEIKFILNLPNDETADYGEEGNLTPRAAYMAKLANAKPLFSAGKLPIGPDDAPEFGETAIAQYGSDVDLASVALDRKIRAYASANNVEYAEAMIRVGATY